MSPSQHAHRGPTDTAREFSEPCGRWIPANAIPKGWLVLIPAQKTELAREFINKSVRRLDYEDVSAKHGGTPTAARP
jgi:hypothetical protein